MNFEPIVASDIPCGGTHTIYVIPGFGLTLQDQIQYNTASRKTLLLELSTAC
jgi:hypothetical protein